MRACDLEVRSSLGVERAVKEPRASSTNFQVGAVQLGKCLLILALDHDLGLGLQRLQAKGVDVFDPDLLAFGLLENEPALLLCEWATL